MSNKNAQNTENNKIDKNKKEKYGARIIPRKSYLLHKRVMQYKKPKRKNYRWAKFVKKILKQLQ